MTTCQVERGISDRDTAKAQTQEKGPAFPRGGEGSMAEVQGRCGTVKKSNLKGREEKRLKGLTCHAK